jgi:hypothetical protein
MTELAAPSAKRLQKPTWRDSRLLVGVLLVLLAATLGAKAIASADDRRPYYVAADDLVPGDRVAKDSFKRVDVLLSDGLTPYVTADAPPPEGQYVLRGLKAGELVPASALGAADQVGVQRVTVRVDSVSAQSYAKGSLVDVYITPKSARGSDSTTAKTERTLERVTVAAVLTDGGGFGANATTSVQVLVPSDKVQAVIGAVEADAKVNLVPVAGSAQ